MPKCRLIFALGLLWSSAHAAPQLAPRWDVAVDVSRTAHIVGERDAIYVTDRGFVTCFETKDGAVRWQTKIPPPSDDRDNPRAEAHVLPEAICVVRRAVSPILDILDRRTGKVRASIVFQWCSLDGLVSADRFAIVCTTLHGEQGQIRFHQVDLVTGKRYDHFSSYVGRSLWQPYYAFGGQLFRVDRPGGVPHVTPLPIWTDHFMRRVKGPKHIWIIPGDRALVSGYDPFQYYGAGADLSLWKLDPFEKLWSVGVHAPESGIRDQPAFTKAVFTQGDEVWLDAGQVFRLRGAPERVEGPMQLFQMRGDLFGVMRRRNRQSGNEIQRLGQDGSFKPVAMFPSVQADFARFVVIGENIVRLASTGWGDSETSRLALFRLF